MKLDVYDTYVVHNDSERMHFDVLLPEGGDQQIAFDFAMQWLKSTGINPENISLEKCQFCHSEAATPEIEGAVSSQGFAILQMEGCPSPIS